MKEFCDCAKIVDLLAKIVYNKIMTPIQQQFNVIKAVPYKGNKVIIDKNELEAFLAKQQEIMDELAALPYVLEAEAEYKRTGISYDADEVLKELREKYVK